MSSHLRSILVAMNENNFLCINMNLNGSPDNLNKVLEAGTCIIQQLNWFGTRRKFSLSACCAE